jgi:hypothetical protein
MSGERLDARAHGEIRVGLECGPLESDADSCWARRSARSPIELHRQNSVVVQLSLMQIRRVSQRRRNSGDGLFLMSLSAALGRS